MKKLMLENGDKIRLKNFRLPQSLWQRLEAQAIYEQRTEIMVVRRAIERYLDQEGPVSSRPEEITKKGIYYCDGCHGGVRLDMVLPVEGMPGQEQTDSKPLSPVKHAKKTPQPQINERIKR